jgi:hypothetical protein
MRLRGIIAVSIAKNPKIISPPQIHKWSVQLECHGTVQITTTPIIKFINPSKNVSISTNALRPINKS